MAAEESFIPLRTGARRCLSTAPGENLSRALADRVAEYSAAIMAELKRAPKKGRKGKHSRGEAKSTSNAQP